MRYKVILEKSEEGFSVSGPGAARLPFPRRYGGKDEEECPFEAIKEANPDYEGR
jgi:hypothetical protein